MKLNNLAPNQTEIVKDGNSYFYSYRTLVAANVDGKFYRTDKFHSKTTSKHINSWLNGAKATEMPQEWFDNLI
jgi:hypothetical protein